MGNTSKTSPTPQNATSGLCDYKLPMAIFAFVSLACIGGVCFWFANSRDSMLFKTLTQDGSIDKNVKYSTCLQASGKIINTACSMCSEQFHPAETVWVVRSCRHAFHEVCEDGRSGLKSWLQKNKKCHFCKLEIGHAKPPPKARETKIMGQVFSSDSEYWDSKTKTSRKKSERRD